MGAEPAPAWAFIRGSLEAQRPVSRLLWLPQTLGACGRVRVNLDGKGNAEVAPASPR